jgi:hypothetical protein
MKKYKLLLICVLLGSLHSCCWDGNCDDTDDDILITEPFESGYEPIVLDRDAFEQSVKLLPAKPIVNSGKIYVLNNLLFVNEKNEGFHVFQNDDPSNPTPINFIEVPGSSDVSIRNGVYFVNQAVDLIAIVYNTRSSELTISKRIEDVFPVMLSPDGFYPFDIDQNSIVVGWKLKS